MTVPPNHSYRDDIDGLRAIAVVPVILFHADITLWQTTVFPGGFLGVDVFFVISGYLISGMILAQLSKDRFRLTEFYRRRIKRLFPAACSVILTCLPLSWLLFQPEDFTHFITSALAALAFVSNIWFATGSEYFADTTEHMPLLHTWSLSVEEQFYFVFPIFLMALWRWTWGPRWVFRLVIGATVLSLVSYVMLQTRAPNWAFYLSITRGWELLVGVAVAVKGNSLSPVLRQSPWLAVAGLGLLLIAMIFSSDIGAAQMIGRLAAVLGTACLLVSGAGSHGVGTLLRKRSMVGIGRVSYSLYLWHWPGLAYLSYLQLDSSVLTVILVLGISLGLALASYRWIETPLRYHSSVRPALVLCAVTVAMVGAMWIWAASSEGRLGRDMAIAPVIYPDGVSEWPSGNVTVPDASFHVINVGDSHSGALIPALSAWGQAQGVSVTHLQSSGVLPVQGMSFITDGHALAAYQRSVTEYLLGLIDGAITSALERGETPFLLLSARWPYYLSGQLPVHPQTGAQEPGGSHVPSLDGQTQASGPMITAALEQTLSHWQELGAQVIIAYPVPEQIYHPGRLSFAGVVLKEFVGLDSAAWPFGLPTALPYKSYSDRSAEARAMLDGLQTKSLLGRLYPGRVVCPVPDIPAAVRSCPHKIDGMLLYRDDDHLSAFGAWLVVQQGLLPLLLQAGHSPR